MELLQEVSKLLNMIQKTSLSGKWSLYGEIESEIFIAGHSHAGSVLEAKLGNVENTILERVAICYSSDLNSGPPGNDEYWNFVAEISKGKDLAIVWNGNQHNANFLFQTSPPFTLVSDKSEATDEVLISRTMMKSFFEPSFQELSSIIKSMADVRSISLVSGPAPKPLSHITNRISSEEFFVNIARSLGVDVGDLKITSDSLRVEMWTILGELLEKAAIDLGAKYIPAPPETIDSNGLLFEKYWTPDVTHANSDYGIKLADHISNYVSGGMS